MNLNLSSSIVLALVFILVQKTTHRLRYSTRRSFTLRMAAARPFRARRGGLD